MTYQSFLIKYGEIAIKGENRHIFEDALLSQISNALRRVEGDFAVSKENGRMYVAANGPYDYEELMGALSKVFGVVAVCPMIRLEDEGFQRLAGQVEEYVDEAFEKKDFSFKVDARRARKNYPMTSMELAAALGERILEAFPGTRVDVHHPQVVIHVEIRSHINVYAMSVPGPGGMPAGTAGKATLLLSGGIDSPVAGYMVAKRGARLEAVYFHAPPYTSERAKEKVIDLAKILSEYCGKVVLHVVNFTEIQLYIYERCPHDQLTIIMRRYMMRIAEHFARESGSLGLVTGESIGQVASQTMSSLLATDEVSGLPVYRPLIGFDKQEIVDISEKIGTYETSILPFEDCCTIFVAEHPVTKPNLKSIKKSETRLQEKIGMMMQAAIDGAETVCIAP